MHFIEQLFGLAPDGGNGLLEIFVVMLPFVVALWMMKRTTLSDHAS